MVFREVKNTSRNEDEPKGLEKKKFEIMDEGSDSVEEEIFESDEEMELQTPTVRRFDRARRPVERYSTPNFLFCI